MTNEIRKLEGQRADFKRERTRFFFVVGVPLCKEGSGGKGCSGLRHHSVPCKDLQGHEFAASVLKSQLLCLTMPLLCSETAVTQGWGNLEKEYKQPKPVSGGHSTLPVRHTFSESL